MQDNLAQVVLWVNKKLMDAFGYTTPKTWQDWAALGQKVATEHPGYIVGNIGDSFSHWIYLWGNQCPLEKLQGDKLLINSTDAHCTRDGQPARPADQERHAPAAEHLHPGLRQEVRRREGQGADDARAGLVRAAVFDQTLHMPAGEITAAPPLQWGTDTPVTTGQVGGGPWIISRHSKNRKAAADFVIWATTVFNPTGKDARAGYPAYAPLADKWLADPGHQPVLRGRSDAGAEGRGQPDLDGLEPGDLPGPAGLVQHRGHAAGGREVAELAAATLRRRPRPGGAGGGV